MKTRAAVAAVVLLCALSGCSGSAGGTPDSQPVQEAATSEELDVNSTATVEESANANAAEKEDATMKMSIAGTDVTVEWEDNAAVSDLRALVADTPLTVDLSMYGGFEQVGSLGTSLTAEDVQTTTEAGDIVLYAGDQIVVFYGSNTWAYTRLGHITSQSAEGMADLLGNGDVSITISSGVGE